MENGAIQFYLNLASPDETSTREGCPPSEHHLCLTRHANSQKPRIGRFYDLAPKLDIVGMDDVR